MLHALGICPNALPPLFPSPWQTPACDVPLSVFVCSHCSTPTFEWQHAMFGFLSLCEFAENDGFQLYPCPCKEHDLISFYGYIVFHGVYAPHFFNPVYHWWALGIWVDSVSLLLWIMLQWTYACMTLYTRMISIHLDIYPVIRLWGRMVFLILDPWGITTLSPTMVELIYTPTNSIKTFPFLHILSSICCFLTF